MKNSGFFRKFTAGITAIITCFSMSAVASYADEIIYGDVNCDGVVTALDLMNMKEYLLSKKTLTDEQKTNSDMNSDLNVNIIDLILLKQAFIESITVSENIITLKGDTIVSSGNGITVDGTNVTINSSGVYKIEGTMTADAVITVMTSAEDTGDVEITLKDVSMKNSTDTPCIMVENAEKTKITFEGENTFVNTYDAATSESSVFYAKDDITFTKNSTGTLKINTNACMAIYCNNDINFNGGTIDIKTDSDGSGLSEADAVKAKNDIEIKGTEISVNTEGDGIKSTKKAVIVSDGSVSVKSGKDALQGETAVTITGGSVVASGDRGITSVGTLDISGGTVFVTATDNQSSYAESNFTQPVLAVDFSGEHAKSEKFILLPKLSTENSLTFKAEKKYNYVLVSDEAFKAGGEYQICIDSDYCSIVNGEAVFSAAENFVHLTGVYPLIPPQ